MPAHLRQRSFPTALRVLASLAAVLAVACGRSHQLPAGAVPPAVDAPPISPPPDADAGAPADPPPVPPPPPPPAPPPPAPPPAALIGIQANAVVSGHVILAASVPPGTVQAEFRLDGAVLATAAAPFSATWDSFSSQNGAHALSVRAFDAAGAIINASEPIQVTLANHVKHVFVIVMENHDWSAIKGSSAAPYINGTMLVQGAHAEKYMNVPGLHPSLPNYIWLEAGSNLGVWDDSQPVNHKLTTTQHLVTLLQNAGTSWKSYQEDIPGTNCPLDYVNNYGPKHNPMIYFTDTNGGLNWADPYCIAHVRPYTELTVDLAADTVPTYSFITPNLCNDMHDCGIAAGDAWLAREVPKILASKAYQEGGAIFLTWDESAGTDVPIGLVLMSPLAKPGYSNSITYTHSSTLRTLQDVFGVNAQYLGDAANATDLRDLFRSYP